MRTTMNERLLAHGEVPWIQLMAALGAGLWALMFLLGRGVA